MEVIPGDSVMYHAAGMAHAHRKRETPRTAFETIQISIFGPTKAKFQAAPHVANTEQACCVRNGRGRIYLPLIRRPSYPAASALHIPVHRRSAVDNTAAAANRGRECSPRFR